MKFVNAAIFSFTTISAATSITPTSAAAQVAQDRIIGASMNSLYYHSNEFQNVPTWLDRMADADGGKRIAAQGTYDVRSNNPPNWTQNWLPDVASLHLPTEGAASWARANAANITDMIIVTDNFSGPPVYTDTGTNPRVGGPVPIPNAADWVYEITNSIIVPFEANTDDDPTYWIYEGWADGGNILAENGTANAGNFAAWRDRTTGGLGYGQWFDNLAAALQEDTPAAASRIKVIPVARTIVSVMENTAASALASEDWFEDDAPHGRATLYLLASMIVYSSLYQEPAPMPDFTGTQINDVFRCKYNSIAVNIFDEM
jgi:hypothetical protein